MWAGRRACRGRGSVGWLQLLQEQSKQARRGCCQPRETRSGTRSHGDGQARNTQPNFFNVRRVQRQIAWEPGRARDGEYFWPLSSTHSPLQRAACSTRPHLGLPIVIASRKDPAADQRPRKQNNTKKKVATASPSSPAWPRSKTRAACPSPWHMRCSSSACSNCRPKSLTF